MTIITLALFFMSLILGCACYVLGADNERWRRQAWNRRRTADRLRRLRALHQDFEAYVNADVWAEQAGRN